MVQNKKIILSILVILVLQTQSQLNAQQKQNLPDSIPISPYHGCFEGFNNGDSISTKQFASLGSLLSSNRDLRVISFRLSGSGACCGGIFCTTEVNSNLMPEEYVKTFIRGGSGTIFFDEIKVVNKMGKIFCVKAFYLHLRP